MTARTAAEFMGLGDIFGRIATGYRANLVALSPDMQVVETWIDGQRSASENV